MHETNKTPSNSYIFTLSDLTVLFFNTNFETLPFLFDKYLAFDEMKPFTSVIL